MSDVQKNLYVFEGGDACGKATQAKRLAETLNTRVISFPRYGVGETGALIDDILHERFTVSMNESLVGQRKSTEPDPMKRILQAFMTWDRYTCKDLWDAKEANLVLDRYWMSGAVYGHLDGISMDELLQAHKGLPTPKVAFLLDLPVDIQMQRLEGRGRVPDRYEAREGLRERLEKLREFYLAVWRQHGPARFSRTNWVIIDGTANAETVTNKVLQHVGGWNTRDLQRTAS